MVQFNLLPDIKIQFLKARRQKRMVMFVSTVTIVASVAVLTLLLTVVFVLQRKSMSDLNADIKNASGQLQNTKDLTKILTVQNQLKSLPDLHAQKPVASRLYSYVSQVTPSDASIARINVDFNTHKMIMSGSAKSLEVINKFADTLKFTTFTADGSTTSKQAFSDVVLSTFGRDSKGASYVIIFDFDPLIFTSTQELTLTVPKIITTRSQTEQPSALFQKAEPQTQGGNQ